MDSIAFIGIGVLIAFALPVVILALKQKKNKKRLELHLSGIEKEHGIKISEHETWRNKIIGLDAAGKKALLVVKEGQENRVSLVNLSHITKCDVEKTTVASDTDVRLQAVGEVRIRFFARQKTEKEQVFVLFRDDTDHNLGPELSIASCWAEKYNRLVKA